MAQMNKANLSPKKNTYLVCQENKNGNLVLK